MKTKNLTKKDLIAAVAPHLDRKSDAYEMSLKSLRNIYKKIYIRVMTGRCNCAHCQRVRGDYE